MNEYASTEFFVVGAGGLGCPALLGLGAAGARRVTVVDHDRVEASNLQRQVLFDASMVGMAKADAAVAKLRRRHRGLTARASAFRLEPIEATAWIESLPGGAVVLECSDQPALKFAVNDACLRFGVPLVVGAALGFRGQAMAVLPGHACYRCIYEEPPPPQLQPTCDQAGVLGPAVGHVGSIMAALATGLVRDPEETAGRLLTIDLLRAEPRGLSPRPRRSCSACRTSASPEMRQKRTLHEPSQRS